MTDHSSSMVRSATFLSKALSFEKAISIGLKPEHRLDADIVDAFNCVIHLAGMNDDFHSTADWDATVNYPIIAYTLFCTGSISCSGSSRQFWPLMSLATVASWRSMRRIP